MCVPFSEDRVFVRVIVKWNWSVVAKKFHHYHVILIENSLGLDEYVILTLVISVSIRCQFKRKMTHWTLSYNGIFSVAGTVWWGFCDCLDGCLDNSQKNHSWYLPKINCFILNRENCVFYMMDFTRDMSTNLFKCDICSKTFTRKNNLKRHYLSHNPNRELFQCHKCHKHFNRSDSVVRHVCGEKNHFNSYLKCEICCKHFSRSDNLKVHKRKCVLKKDVTDKDQVKLDLIEKTRVYNETSMKRVIRPQFVSKLLLNTLELEDEGYCLLNKIQ